MNLLEIIDPFVLDDRLLGLIESVEELRVHVSTLS
jgi:hypothetical protein